MGQIHYSNLENHRPDILLNQTRFGLKPFNEYLWSQKKFLESYKSVKFVGWEKQDEKDKACWIRLTEIESIKLDMDSLLKLFLDESVTNVYEIDIPNNKGKINFQKSNKIKVVKFDPDTESLCLERYPVKKLIAIQPNTYQINRQIQAIEKLRDEPNPFHRPLLRLFESVNYAQWPSQNGFSRELLDVQWKILKDETRPGTNEQRSFVKKALSTPDFAVLEGPPGSGKTTVICELIRHLCENNKRVLLCASTHVAVDNVLERLMDEDNEWRDEIIPIRIGDAQIVSDKVKDFQLGNFIGIEQKRIIKAIKNSGQPSQSQIHLKNELQNNNYDVLKRLVLDCANLICGTTIGILQHPDIKDAKNYGTPQFDFMIIDEASKTTFQEFLVPALLAKRWILVGDPMQLSPFVDDDALSANFEAVLPDETHRNACLDVFMANKKGAVTIAATDNPSEKEIYLNQAKAHGIRCVDADTDPVDLPCAEVVIGSLKGLDANKDLLPLDAGNLRGDDLDEEIKRQVTSWVNKCNVEIKSWENEIAWRVTRLYEQRFAKSFLSSNDTNRTVERLRNEIEKLLPVVEKDNVQKKIDSIRKVALPSVLESLKIGFERENQQRNGTALTDGLPARVFSERAEKLLYQHRMHPDIADFSHHHFYESTALCTPHYLEEKRNWAYNGFPGKHAIWLDIKGRANGNNSNSREAQEILNELEKFDKWSQNNSRDDGKPWKVALLTFYRGQEREIRNQVRVWTQNLRDFRYFRRGDKSAPYLEIQICTVDRFQGHEADLVFLSFVKNHPTSFLESPNRLNVAITRARYQLVIVGDRNAMQKSNGFVGKLAKEMDWDQRIPQKKHHPTIIKRSN